MAPSVEVGVGVGKDVCVGVEEAGNVLVGVDVAVEVIEGVGVGVAMVVVGVGVGVDVLVGVFVGVGNSCSPLTSNCIAAFGLPKKFEPEKLSDSPLARFSRWISLFTLQCPVNRSRPSLNFHSIILSIIPSSLIHSS